MATRSSTSATGAIDAATQSFGRLFFGWREDPDDDKDAAAPSNPSAQSPHASMTAGFGNALQASGGGANVAAPPFAGSSYAAHYAAQRGHDAHTGSGLPAVRTRDQEEGDGFPEGYLRVPLHEQVTEASLPSPASTALPSSLSSSTDWAQSAGSAVMDGTPVGTRRQKQAQLDTSVVKTASLAGYVVSHPLVTSFRDSTISLEQFVIYNPRTDDPEKTFEEYAAYSIFGENSLVHHSIIVISGKKGTGLRVLHQQRGFAEIETLDFFLKKYYASGARAYLLNFIDFDGDWYAAFARSQEYPRNKPYDKYTNNCEHFVTYVMDGNRRSYTLENLEALRFWAASFVVAAAVVGVTKVTRRQRSRT